MVQRIRTLKHRPYWEKDICKHIGLSIDEKVFLTLWLVYYRKLTHFFFLFKPSKTVVIANTATNCAKLWKVKHLIRITPVTFPQVHQYIHIIILWAQYNPTLLNRVCLKMVIYLELDFKRTANFVSSPNWKVTPNLLNRGRSAPPSAISWIPTQSRDTCVWSGWNRSTRAVVLRRWK